jgi:DNA modification methylase
MQPRVRSDADLRDSLERIDWNFVDYNPSERAPEIHGLHWYPAPFPPGLAGTLIDVLGTGGTYLDPFSGSAVGPIEAWLRGYAAFGIDVNPAASRIARAKMTLLRLGSAEDGRLLCNEYTRARNQQVVATRSLTSEQICEASSIDPEAIRWFMPQVLEELAIVKDWIANGETVAAWREAVAVLVSAVLHKRLSELREVHYTYIVDRSRTKRAPSRDVDTYSEIIKKITGTFVRFEITRNRLERAGVMPGIARSDPVFLTGSSEECVMRVAPDIDLVITSPPYFGMNDYVRSQYLTHLIFPDDAFEHQLDLEIGTRRNRRSMVKLDEYLELLIRCFKEIGMRMRVNGCVAVVLGTSHASRASVRPGLDALENALSAAELKMLWTGTRRVIYRKINNTPFREEHIWVLRKAE